MNVTTTRNTSPIIASVAVSIAERKPMLPVSDSRCGNHRSSNQSKETAPGAIMSHNQQFFK